ncbi:hypothetical protein IKG31_01460 [Candidatus Saccharibacteria bacterium]|nr:hypothetical protein [Candidatus Saccharibacteria bacterium]
MENDASNSANVNQSINFHSENIANTKAKEKREIFINVQQERPLERGVKSIQQKYDEIRTSARDAIASQKERIVEVKKRGNNYNIKKIIIIILIITALGAGSYLIYRYLIKDDQPSTYNTVSEYLATDPEKFISTYDQLIDKASSSIEKIDLLFARINALRYTYGEEYAEQMLQDAYRAHEIYPSYTTAKMIIELEQEYGTDEKAKEWQNKLNEYRGIEIYISNG